MRFDQIPGNVQIKEALVGMIDSGRIPHAIMFHENDGCGALAFALAFLQYLDCRSREGGDSCGQCPSCNKVSKLIHPDIHFIFPVTKGSKVTTDKPTSESYLKYWRELVSENPYFLENQLNEALGIETKSSVIAVSEAKFILDKLSLSALEGGYKSVVVYLPEKMNTETANRLLKSIEEPPESTQFIFITHAPEKVLATISSRCLSIRLMPLGREEVAGYLVDSCGAAPEEAARAAAVAGGSIGVALDYLRNSEEAGSELELFLSLMKALSSRNLYAALEVGDALASLPSRENAKAFCKFAAGSLRKIFMIQQGLAELSLLTEAEDAPFKELARTLKRSFPREALAYLDEAQALISRNVSLKILFCDLVDRLYLTLWTTV